MVIITSDFHEIQFPHDNELAAWLLSNNESFFNRAFEMVYDKYCDALYEHQIVASSDATIQYKSIMGTMAVVPCMAHGWFGQQDDGWLLNEMMAVLDILVNAFCGH